MFLKLHNPQPSTSGVELGKELALSFLEPNRYRRVLCQEKASSIGKSTLSNHCPTSLSAGFIRSLPNSRAMLASQKSTMGSRLVLVCLLFFWAGLSYANKNEKRDFCILPSETGVCKMYIPRFFFNPTTKKCEKFIYGGCGGNKNNFETEKECLRACSGPL
uniref:BPTI/Kunitz inhibitor domain-containing protein n=1 Tax=Anolis carolinensis TaxID=28377 RepID=R4GDF2_ANOCA